MTGGRREGPAEISGYVAELVERVRAAIGEDLLGIWLVGGAAHGAYEHGISDVDVLAVTGSRWPGELRRELGKQVVHPSLPCPTGGLEFVWYAYPDLVNLADPVQFQLNVNGGLNRASVIQLAPGSPPGYWSVLDLAAARAVSLPLQGAAPAADVIPPVPVARVRQAVAESLTWHDDADAGSPNRVLNLARLLAFLERGTWVSKPAGAAALSARL